MNLRFTETGASPKLVWVGVRLTGCRPRAIQPQRIREKRIKRRRSHYKGISINKQIIHWNQDLTLKKKMMNQRENLKATQS